MTAIGYVRCSKKSGARAVSLEEQAARVRAYCASQGWALAELVTDDGVSGGKRARLVRLAERVRALKARAVVTYHLDRFARDVAALLDTVRAWGRRGCELHVVGRGRVEVDTATGFLLTGVEALMAEHYRRLVGEKTRDALARLKGMGRRVSRFVPYGSQLGQDGVTLEPEASEQATLSLILALAPGRSLRELSAALVERGVVARSGRPFSPAVLWRLVSNRTVGNRMGGLAEAVA